MLYVIVTVNPNETVYGPFGSEETANAWAHAHCVGWCWHCIKVSNPS